MCLRLVKSTKAPWQVYVGVCMVSSDGETDACAPMCTHAQDRDVCGCV